MNTAGFSLLEVLLTTSLVVVVSGAAVPLALGGADRSRAAGAARYVAGRLAAARFEAVRRSAHVAVRIQQRSDGYWLRTYVDGNRNGVLTSEIALGIDRPLSADEQLGAHFSGVVFGIQPGVTAIDAGQPFNPLDPVQTGPSSLISFSPTGTSTSGTLFLTGRGGRQFAVRLFGATGRTRILEFSFAGGTWHTP